MACLPYSSWICRYGYPAFIALNPKEAKYAALRESYSYENAVTFIERLRQVGRCTYSTIRAGILSFG